MTLLQVGLVVLSLTPALVAGAPAHYAVVSDSSALTVHVGRAGLLKFAGHEHEVVTSAIEGEIVADSGDLARSSVRLRFAAAGLRVSGKGEPEKDLPKVQAKMEGPDVLDVARFPEITFTSRAVKGTVKGPGTYALTVSGDLTLHGATRAVELPLEVTVEAETLTTTGRFALSQTDYGMKPVSVAGVVNVKNEVAIEFRIVARPQTAEGSVK
jgi:polyisoprenoid-binding protein YceI